MQVIRLEMEELSSFPLYDELVVELMKTSYNGKFNLILQMKQKKAREIRVPILIKVPDRIWDRIHGPLVFFLFSISSIPRFVI